jgi:transposase
MSHKHKAAGTWSVRPNGNISVPIGNAVLSEAFFRKYGLEDIISGLKKKGTDLGKLAELLVAYKLGDNFSILRAHEFIMQPEIRRRFGIEEFDVKGLYRAVERLGENRETIISAFRNRVLREYGKEVTDVIFDWTSLVYFGYKPELAARGHSRDGRPEECQMTVGIAQLAKPLCIPVGMTVMPGNTHDSKHMINSYAQVKDDLGPGKTMVFDAGANCKDTLDRMIGDGNNFLTRKKLNKSDDKLFKAFSEKEWELIDKDRGEYCLKKKFPSRVNYYFFSRELFGLNMAARKKKADKLYREAVSLQNDLDMGKKLKKKYLVSNDLLIATVYIQTRLTEMTAEEARSYIFDKSIDGREGFFCLTSNMDIDPVEIRRKYKDKDCVEKLFSSMKSDIGIRPIRAWTDNGVYGVLLIGFLAQSLIAMTRLLAEPASGRATKFISDAMQKLTLTVKRNGMKGTEFIMSNFNPMNTAILRAFGVIREEGAM